MSYLNFLLLYIALPIIIMAFTLPRPLAGRGTTRTRWAIGAICLIAFAYTTPWDNYLVYREVWWYGPDRVLGTIYFVPYEEYAFFILQPIMTGLFYYHMLGRRPSWAEQPLPEWITPAQGVGALMYAALTAWGVWLLTAGGDSGLYMGLILSWACPVLLGIWIYGGSVIWSLVRGPAAITVGISTGYLWVADWFAISDGIWEISAAYTFGIDPFGLPIEEATFFLVTNILVVKGVTLFLAGDLISAQSWSRKKLPTKRTAPNVEAS
ncbi:MAG: lycopene cyclase domain-containing protein [Bacteroidetes bacterium]|jgi:lycopene cyclase domain-containing protein|nr:lycopene cyclase domain-containing protein [Bacteroidota bacterium]